MLNAGRRGGESCNGCFPFLDQLSEDFLDVPFSKVARTIDQLGHQAFDRLGAVVLRIRIFAQSRDWRFRRLSLAFLLGLHANSPRKRDASLGTRITTIATTLFCRA